MVLIFILPSTGRPQVVGKIECSAVDCFDRLGVNRTRVWGDSGLENRFPLLHVIFNSRSSSPPRLVLVFPLLVCRATEPPGGRKKFGFDGVTCRSTTLTGDAYRAKPGQTLFAPPAKPPAHESQPADLYRASV